MGEDKLNWKDYHHQVYQIYHGLIALTLVPFALLFLEWDSQTEKVIVDYGSFLFIATAQLIWVIGYACWYVWKGSKVMVELQDEMSLQDKLKEFKRKNLYKYLLLAFSGFASALAMWIQPSFLFVVAYFVILIQYSFLRPSEDKFVRDMRLTKEERSRLHRE